MISYKFKLYSNATRSSSELNDLIDVFGHIYNYCIGTHKRYYEWYGKFLNKYALINHITKIKKTNNGAWIKYLPSQAVQDVAFRIDKAYSLFFRNRKHKIKASPPRFKPYKTYKSFTLTQAGYKFVDDNVIRIHDKEYKYIKTREINGNVKTVTIKRDNVGNLWLIIVTDYERSEKKVASGKIVGFDFGMSPFLTGSNGATVDFPLFLRNSLNKLKVLNRRLSKKKKGSNNRSKAKKTLARFHQKIQNQRNDYQWKLAHKLLADYDVICLEDLNLKGMSKHFGKKIGDFGFYNFVEKLKYLAGVFGKQIKQVDRFYPSSKTCSNCGYVNKELRLSDRKWVCPVCGTAHHRDQNAAVNILRGGASSLGVNEVRPDLTGIHC